MIEGRKRRRNTLAVKMDLVNAVGTTLKKYGFSKLGISLVAQEAKVDKTVIYRNYTDFDKLLEAYIEKQDYWLQALKEVGENKIDDKREFMKQVLIDQFNTIYASKELQQLLIWGLSDNKGYISTIALKREIMSEGINEQYGSLLDDYGLKFNYISALMIAGIYYIVLNKDQSTFCNTDINTKKDKQEFIAILEWLVDLVFDKMEKINEMEQVAIRAHKNGINNEVIAEITNLSIERISEIIK